MKSTLDIAKSITSMSKVISLLQRDCYPLNLLNNYLRLQVKWENRLKNSVSKNMNVTLDGTDFTISEPKPFNKKWFSHKFKGRVKIYVKIGKTLP